MDKNHKCRKREAQRPEVLGEDDGDHGDTQAVAHGRVHNKRLIVEHQATSNESHQTHQHVREDERLDKTDTGCRCMSLVFVPCQPANDEEGADKGQGLDGQSVLP